MNATMTRLRAIVAAAGMAAGALNPSLTAADRAAVADAAQNRDHPGLRQLVAQGADVNTPQPDGATALHWAAHWDEVETAGMLIRAGADVNRRNDVGVFPLMLACGNGSGRMVETLLAARANPNLTLASGETAVMACARTGNAAAVQAVLDAGADRDARTVGLGQTALMWAAAEGHAEVVRTLIAAGADVNARTSSGFTPLLFAARRGDLGSAQRLVASGARIDDRTPDGSTPLLIAALSVDAVTARDYRLVPTPSGHESVALFLVGEGADATLADGFGMTPLHAAVEMDKPRLLASLLARGVNPNVRLSKGLPFRRADIISRAYYAGATPFWLAAKKGDVSSMRALVGAGADPNIPSDNGTTPLLVAAGLGQSDARLPPEDRLLDAVTFALELGCDPHARNDAGRNAVHGAASVSANVILKFVAERGVDVNASDKRGQTPLDLARDPTRPRHATADVLIQLGALSRPAGR